MLLVLLVLCLVLMFGGLPTWDYHNYGYAPSGVGLVLVILLVLVLLGWR